MNLSLFHFYSYGIAAENKVLSSKILPVVPIEALNFIDGEINTNLTTIEDSGVDANNQAYSVKVDTDIAIDCEWFPFSSNRLTAPDIRRGERIVILRYADSDKFYWVPDGRDEHLRRLETVTWRFSDTTDESDVKITDANSYQFSVSTHESLITLKTAKSNNEPFLYTIQVNAKEGIVVIADDAGNYIEMNSRDTAITLENADKSKLVLDKTHGFLETVDTLNFKTKTINVEANDINTEATKITTKANTIATTTTTQMLNASSYTITSNVTIAGQTVVNGASAFTGTLTSNGINVSGNHVHPKGPSSNPNTLTPL